MHLSNESILDTTTTTTTTTKLISTIKHNSFPHDPLGGDFPILCGQAVNVECCRGGGGEECGMVKL